MKAKTHPGDEQKAQTSSNQVTMNSENMRKGNGGGRDKANRELKPTGLTVDDIAEQSAYESDKDDISHVAANSDRNEKVTWI